MIPPNMFFSGNTLPRPARGMTSTRFKAMAVSLLVLAACGDAPESESASEEGAVQAASVQIVEPADGATVGSSVLIRLEVAGLTIAPAGTMDPGTGHHHLVVDADIPAPGSPIPSTEGTHIHMGQAQTEYEITGLAAGEHTVIAVVGDGAHMPLMPTVADTVRFVVQ